MRPLEAWVTAISTTSDAASRHRLLTELRSGAERMLSDPATAADAQARTHAFLAVATANLHLAADTASTDREQLAERGIAACEQAVAAASRIPHEPAAEAHRALLGILNASLSGLASRHRSRITPLITEVARLLDQGTGGDRS